MMRSLAMWIGLRYTRAKRRNRLVSFISLVSMLGIVIGVTALITVVSVMNGFEGELRTRLLGMVSHATISAADNEGGMGEWHEAIDISARDPRVLGAAPYVEREGLLQGRRGLTQPALLRGIDPNQEGRVSQLPESMVHGDMASLVPGEFNIVLGKELALWLNVDIGDTVTVFVPEFRTTPVGVLPQMKRFTVTGIFEVGLQEADLQLALINLGDAQKLLRLGDKVSGVRLKLTDMFDAWNVARDLGDHLGGYYRIRDWSRDHANFFRAIRMEKTVMFVILSLIIFVAAINLVSSLVMLVTDKQADIAILRTLGMTPGTVMRVFMVQGMFVGVIGVVVGVTCGVLLTLNLTHIVNGLEAVLGYELMPSDVYYISGVPVELRWGDVSLVAGIAFLFSLLATIYPAWRASRTDPAEALRYE